MGDQLAQRRGFFAEIQHQQRLAQAQANAAARAQSQAYIQAERARAARERANAAASRASEAERKRYEKEAQAAYVELRLAEVDELNEELAQEYDEIDSMLSATLAVDDFVDLEGLKRGAVHPPFPRPDLEVPRPAPLPIPVPEAPSFIAPSPPTGLFGRKKKLEEATQRTQFEYQQALQQWEAYRAAIPVREAELAREHEQLEQSRIKLLAAERETYDAACQVREAEAVEHNSSVDALIAGLGYGAVEAVHEYIGIVLANSIYPDTFDVEHQAEFQPETAELTLKVIVPAPEELRTVKTHRYVKASDEISETQLSKKDAGDRYANALHQVALRSLHEIFEADRRGLVQAISLQVGPSTKDPATGREMFIPLIAVTSPRSTFTEFNLSGVVPSATLQHLGAAVSKSPANLTAVDPAGVRRS